MRVSIHSAGVALMVRSGTVEQYVVDAVRCPSCKDIVTSHTGIGTDSHVPRCCGMVLVVTEEWDDESHRWVIVCVAMDSKDYEQAVEDTEIPF